MELALPPQHPDVMPGLDPGIRELRRADGRVKPGHDEKRTYQLSSQSQSQPQ
jgi:hypothetical protein